MSKLLFSEFLLLYQQPCTTLARCLRIERRDGKIIALTEHDENLIIDGIIYQSAVGYIPTAISIQDKGTVNTVDVEGILNVAGVSRNDIAAGCFDGARIFIFEVNYEDLSQGILPLISGFWGECQLHDNHYVTEFKSLSQVLQQTVGELYSTHCRAQFGDMRCGVKLDNFAVEGVVASVNNPQEFIAEGFNQVDQYFQYGSLTWQQGKNAGLSMIIQSFQSTQLPIKKTENNESKNYASDESNENTGEISSGVFTLSQPMPYIIEVGDLFQVTPGCDKTLAVCKTRFNNVVNFRGEPFIPGIDHMLKIP